MILCYYSYSTRILIERTNEISERLQELCEHMDGVIRFFLKAGYEVLTEGTGANSGTCLINLKDWQDRKVSAQQLIEELEEKAKNIPGATIEFFQLPSCNVMVLQADLKVCACLIKPAVVYYQLMEKVSRILQKSLNKRKSCLPYLLSTAPAFRNIC